MNTTRLILASLLATSLTLPAIAQNADPAATPGVDKRLQNQDQRVQRGVETGQLTPRESQRMQKRQDKVEDDVARAKADGVVTPQERRQLHRALDRNSAAIQREKHDRQHDYNHDGRTDRPRR